MDYSNLLIADRFNTAFDQLNEAVAHNINKLKSYEDNKETNPHYSDKRADGMRYNIKVTENFLDATVDLVDAQSEMLQAANKTKVQLRIITEQYEKLCLYARSRGLDIDLVQYMNKRELLNY